MTADVVGFEPTILGCTQVPLPLDCSLLANPYTLVWWTRTTTGDHSYLLARLLLGPMELHHRTVPAGTRLYSGHTFSILLRSLSASSQYDCNRQIISVSRLLSENSSLSHRLSLCRGCNVAHYAHLFSNVYFAISHHLWQ